MAEDCTTSNSTTTAAGASVQEKVVGEEVNPHEHRCWETFKAYRQCISSYNQFHEYYIHGKFSDCKEEKALMSNCLKWKAGSEQAKDEFLAGLQRKEDAKTWQNPLWEKRTKPPDDW